MRTAAWALLLGLGVGFGARAQSRDIDLTALARQSMNYLLFTPRPSLGYECQFLIYPLAVPPSRLGQAGSTTGDVITDSQSGVGAVAGSAHDPITWGDTDARMDVVFPYMREMSDSSAGRDVERGLHRRVLGYMRDDGLCWLPSGGMFRPGRDYALAWTNGLLMIRLIENWQRTGDLQDKARARKLFEGIRRLATQRDGCAWHEGGMMPWADGKWLYQYGPKGWTRQPGITWPVTIYWKATRDPEALALARELAEGVLHNSQPGLGVHAFNPDGSFQGGNTHLVLHEVLGVAELGAAIGDARLVAFAQRVYEYVRSLGMDWGWFPEYRVHYLGDGNSETCNTADMIALATCLAEAGEPRYWDHAERYVRNYLQHARFHASAEWERAVRESNPGVSPQQMSQALVGMRRLDGSFLGCVAPDSALIPYHRAQYDSKAFKHRMSIVGCCAPSGMWGLYRVWQRVVARSGDTVYVHMSFSRDDEAARVSSFLPEQGRIEVLAKGPDRTKRRYLVRVPSWADRKSVAAYRDGRAVRVFWGGPQDAYVVFERIPRGTRLAVTYPLVESEQVATVGGRSGQVTVRLRWSGNTVVGLEPRAEHFALFSPNK
jgi:hypothetical protein